MAKQIRTIKCPQCGSIKKTDIKKDTYKCGSCDATYFLDNDDVTINVVEQNPYRNYSSPVISKNKVTGIFIVIALFIIIPFVVLRILIPSGRSETVFSDTSSKFYGTIKKVMLVEDISSDKPQAYFIDSRMNHNHCQDIGCFLVLYDIIGQKVIKEVEIADKSKRSPLYDIRKQFDAWYISENINDANRVLKLSPAAFELEDFGEKLAGRFTELSAGIANIKPEHYIDAFKLMTNDGDEYVYSPYSDKLYKDEREIRADKGIQQHAAFFYGFTQIKTSYCERGKQIQLLQLQARSQNKKLKAYKLEWGYKCELEALWFNGSYSFAKDVTPDRKYFGTNNTGIKVDAPQVLYWNDKAVFAKLKASANPAAAFNLQSIDIETGSLNWSLETTWNEEVEVLDFQEYKDFYILTVKISWREYCFFKIDKQSPELKRIDLPHQYRSER